MSVVEFHDHARKKQSISSEEQRTQLSQIEEKEFF